MEQQQVVVVSGSPVDGITLWGPFDDPTDAMNWVEALGDDPWWITEIKPVVDPEVEVVDRVSQVKAPRHEPEF